jgi:oligopeptide/dipeptide ABC transporter ATP-binding protein
VQGLRKHFRIRKRFLRRQVGVVHAVDDVSFLVERGKTLSLVGERAPTEPLVSRRRHPCTEALLAAVPTPDPRLRGQRLLLEGEVADPAHPPAGCHFHPRCPSTVERCRAETPALQEIAPGHAVSCHRAHELTLRGVAG